MLLNILCDRLGYGNNHAIRLRLTIFAFMDIGERKELLKSHKLRITNCRLDVIGLFLSKSRALSQADLETHFSTYDRVTLYRTLGSFLDVGILHKIPNEDGIATYGLCNETCSSEEHVHSHIHFKCTSCGEIAYLDDNQVPEIKLPVGYQVNMVNVLVAGICVNCSA
ncbi:MAG: transcriptional repressor [Bacteroidota bacterium]